MTLDLKALEREAKRHFDASGILSDVVVNHRQLLGLIERARIADGLAEALLFYLREDCGAVMDGTLESVGKRPAAEAIAAYDESLWWGSA
jgi:hypothetical protein